MAPPTRWGSSPTHGIQPAWCWCTSAVPRVAVINSERSPSSPRAGASTVTMVRPAPPGRRSVTLPLRGATDWVTVPTWSSGTSITARSTGSWGTPSISRRITSGRLTWNSYPSRRIDSMSTASCSSPRPATSITSGDEVGPIRIETLPRTSRSSRSRIWRDVR